MEISPCMYVCMYGHGERGCFWGKRRELEVGCIYRVRWFKTCTILLKQAWWTLRNLEDNLVLGNNVDIISRVIISTIRDSPRNPVRRVSGKRKRLARSQRRERVSVMGYLVRRSRVRRQSDTHTVSSEPRLGTSPPVAPCVCLIRSESRCAPEPVFLSAPSRASKVR